MTTAVIRLTKETKSWAQECLIIVVAAFLITLFGSLSFPLPFSPVPLATQGSFCLLLGVCLGARRASLAVALFMFEGMMGLPVFSLGKSGFWHLMGPTGGYLLGTLIGTYLTGFVFERMKQKGVSSAFYAMAIGNAVIFFCGFCQLSAFIGTKAAVMCGVVPFLIGDFLKLQIAAQFSRIATQKKV